MSRSIVKMAHHPSTTFLFRAVSIIPERAKDSGFTQVRRSRLFDQIDRYPKSKSISSIVGPAGSGKTRLALQWALEQNGPTQYVSARSLNDLQSNIPEAVMGEPNAFGQALADMLNELLIEIKQPDDGKMQLLFQQLVTASQQEENLLIVDDLELIGPGDSEPDHSSFIEALSNFQVEQALLLSRIIAPGGYQTLKTMGNLRVVLPASLEFTTREATEAHSLGIFGTASLEQVLAARNSSRGWIAGMLTALHGHGGDTISRKSFQDIIMNDVLLQQPPAIANIMMASTCVPVNSNSLWERWFDHLNLSRIYIPTVMTQLPTFTPPGHPDGFDIVPVMKTTLQDLRRIAGDPTILHELLLIALHWYVEKREIELAIELAKDHQLELNLIKKLKPSLTELAEQEDWSAIRQMLRDLPEEALIEDPDLTYWYFHAMVEADQWSIMKRIHGVVSETWQNSDDPEQRGRAHLVNSWNAYMLNQADKAVEFCALAYETFPETLHRERMWAAGTASIANSLRGTRPEARRWSALANLEATFTSYPSRWWHNNASPLRYSWMCIVGLMSDAYAVAGQQILSLQENFPLQATRYLLLQAQIDLERMDFESAERLVDTAGQSLDDHYSQKHFYRIVRANIVRAQGDLDAAREILTEVKTPTLQRFDQFAREMFARAHIALDTGDLDSAEFLLNGVAPGDRAWPKLFGDAHPELIRAMILHARGDVEEAISVARATLEEAQARSHFYYVVRAHAILAYIHHHSQQPDLWRKSVQAAISAAGNSEYQLVFIVRTQDVRELGKIPDVELADETAVVARNNMAERLSAREIEVLTLVAQSLSNKQIADEMYISVSTVKNHLASVYDKLGANNRRAAARLARQHGIISD